MRMRLRSWIAVFAAFVAVIVLVSRLVTIVRERLATAGPGSSPRQVRRDALFGRGALGHPRVVPEMRNGSPIGFRIYGVRPGTATAALGLRNGDLVRAVNGFALSTPEQALTAYSEVARSHKLVYEIDRDGQRKVLRCALR